MSLRKQHQPLYLRAAARLRKQVSRLEVGARLPAESRLAREMEVSVATIREALRLLVAEGLVEPQQGRGTLVLPRKERPTGIFLNLDILDPRTSRFYFEAARECRRLLESEGHLVRHYYGRATGESPEDPIECEELFDDLAGGRLRAVITLGAFPEPRLMKALGSLPATGSYEGFARRVSSDVDHFLDLAIARPLQFGRRKIAMLAWNGSLDPTFCNFAQFEAAMHRHGLSTRPEWHRADLHPYLPGAGWETFREVWTAYPEKPDALIITDDCLLPDAAKAITALGIRVPEELLVLSHSIKEAPVAAPFPIDRLSVSAHAAAAQYVHLLSLPGEEAHITPISPQGRVQLLPAEVQLPHPLSAR